MICLSSCLTREEAGRLGEHVLGCSERFYWLSQTCRRPDSAVAKGVLHPRRVTSVIRGLIIAAEVGNHSISLLALMRSEFFPLPRPFILVRCEVQSQMDAIWGVLLHYSVSIMCRSVLLLLIKRRNIKQQCILVQHYQ